MNCTKCGGEVESWWFGINEGWDGEPIQTCAPCGIEQENVFRRAVGAPERTIDDVRTLAETWGY